MTEKIQPYLEAAKKFWFSPQRPWAILGALGFVFLLSLTIALVQPRTMGRFVLFFPHQKEQVMNGEERYLANGGDKTALMARVVQESLLGPVRYDHMRLFAPGTTVRSFIYQDGSAYVDLSHHAVFSWNSNAWWNLTQGLGALEESLKFNFKEIGRVYITVDGQVPFREIGEKK